MGLHKARKYVPLDLLKSPQPSLPRRLSVSSAAHHESCELDVTTHEGLTEKCAAKLLSKTAFSSPSASLISPVMFPMPAQPVDSLDTMEGTPRLPCDLSDFKDFWGEGGDALPHDDDDEFRLRSPRPTCRKTKITDPSCARVALEIFKVETPPQSPRTPVGETKASYTPHWPFASFGCVAPTTLELRGLPREFTSAVLIEQLDAWGFRGFYDLVCVPRREDVGGVAIVNSVRHAEGCSIAKRLNGFSQWKGSGKMQQRKRKACRVSWCFTCQGFAALLEQYRYSSETSGFTQDGSYVGPLVSMAGAWAPLLFAPTHPGHKATNG